MFPTFCIFYSNYSFNSFLRQNIVSYILYFSFFQIIIFILFFAPNPRECSRSNQGDWKVCVFLLGGEDEADQYQAEVKRKIRNILGNECVRLIGLFQILVLDPTTGKPSLTYAGRVNPLQCEGTRCFLFVFFLGGNKKNKFFHVTLVVSCEISFLNLAKIFLHY